VIWLRPVVIWLRPVVIWARPVVIWLRPVVIWPRPVVIWPVPPVPRPGALVSGMGNRRSGPTHWCFPPEHYFWAFRRSIFGLRHEVAEARKAVRGVRFPLPELGLAGAGSYAPEESPGSSCGLRNISRAARCCSPDCVRQTLCLTDIKYGADEPLPPASPAARRLLPDARATPSVEARGRPRESSTA
jgi:hypothetical protein